MRAAPTIAILETRSVPLKDLSPYPANPRNGDIDLIRGSIRAHGQYRAMVVNKRSMQVLAGNHLLHAMLAEDFTEGLCHFVDVDDEEAARIVLVDNRASDVGTYDEGLLAQLLESLPDLAGTGYDDQDLAKLVGSAPNFEPVGEDEQGRLDQLKPVTCPNCGHEFRP